MRTSLRKHEPGNLNNLFIDLMVNLNVLNHNFVDYLNNPENLPGLQKCEK
jgi:hypothetical protein